MSVYISFKNRHPLFIGIYKITSPSGKVYIGQSWDIVERWRAYKSSCPLRGQPKLSNSLQKYGSVNHTFEIVQWFSAGCDQATLDEAERSCMDQCRQANIELLNLREGGISGGRHAPETIAQMVATRRQNGSYVVSEEMRKRRSEQQKGKPGIKHTEATKRRISELNRGRVQTAEQREKNRRRQLGRKHSADTKAKIGAGNRGNKRPDLAERNRRGLTPEQKLKVSTTLKRRNALKRRVGRQGSLFP